MTKKEFEKAVDKILEEVRDLLRKQEAKSLTHSKTIKRKRLRKKLNCDRCPPHRWENASKPQKNWKKFRKTKYKKIKDIE